MKALPFLALLLVGCATPKYQYYFDHYQVTQRPHASGPAVDKQSANIQSTYTLQSTNTIQSPNNIQSASNLQSANNLQAASNLQSPDSDYSPLRIEADQMLAEATTAATASSRKHIADSAPEGPTVFKQNANEQSSPKHLTREDRKEFIHAIRQLRKEVRSKTQLKSTEPLHDQKTQKLDNELIVAISFAAVGITLSILGGLGAAFWIAGVICLGVGVYFFIDWLQKR